MHPRLRREQGARGTGLPAPPFLNLAAKALTIVDTRLSVSGGSAVCLPAMGRAVRSGHENDTPNDPDILIRLVLTAGAIVSMRCPTRSRAKFEEALAQFEYVAQLIPDNATVLMLTGIVLLQLEVREETLAAVDRSVELAPDNQLLTGGNAWTLAAAGERRRAPELLGKYGVDLILPELASVTERYARLDRRISRFAAAPPQAPPAPMSVQR